MVSAAQTAPEKSTCLFYEHVDYKGKHFGLYKGDALITKASVKPESVYKGDFKGRVFTQPEWGGKVSSVKVPKGCTLSMVVESGQSFQGLEKDIPAIAKKYNDQGVGFGCSCK